MRWSKLLKSRRTLAAAIETLELRQLLSAVLGVDGTLTVTGTAADDQIEVDYSTHRLSADPTADMVIVNGTSQTFAVSAVRWIVVNALGGSDHVTINGRVDYFQAGSAAVNISVFGGDGNDTINATITSEPDSSPATTAYIDGGAGNDSITYASTYAATLHGGDGNDTLKASSDDLVLHVAMYGDNGDDQLIVGNFDAVGTVVATLSGGAGNDSFEDTDSNDKLSISGGSGVDTYLFAASDPYVFGETLTLPADVENATGVFGGTSLTIIGNSLNNYINVQTPDGSATLLGGGGDDTLVSNGGPDALFGGPGNDQLTSQDNANTYVDGGPGSDTATVDAGDQVMNVERYHLDSASYVQLSGTRFGTGGSYNNDGNTIAKVFDGDLNTYFDGASANGNVVGLDLGVAYNLGQIKFAPRAGYTGRMIGGKFEASNSASFATFSTLYTVGAAPTAGALTTISVPHSPAYRYVRYVAPAGSYGNITEFQVFAYIPDPPTVAQVLPDGTLLITGTNGPDTIGIDSVIGADQSGTPGIVVTVNGSTQTFSPDAIKAIHIDTLAGNDDVSLSANATDNLTFAPTAVVAGDGNDTFNVQLFTDDSSGGAVTGLLNITAGNGNDSFTINGWNLGTTVHAGDGNDQFSTAIIGSGGFTASLVAGNGNDTFTTGSSGGSGEQLVSITAGIGQDRVFNQDLDDHDSGTIGGQSFSVGWQDELLTGKVYVDRNGDGKYEPVEPTVPNATVSFQNSYDGTVLTTTDANGNYLFNVGFNIDSASPVTHIGPYSITLVPGELAGGVDIAQPAPAKLTGTVIGTSGSYNNLGNTISKVFDGNLTNYFDAPVASGAWAGLDLGSAKIVTQVKYAPRVGFGSRTVGGQIQASNTANFSSGVVTLYTLTSAPASAVFTTQTLNDTTAFRYYRYIGPTNGSCNIAELEFDG